MNTAEALRAILDNLEAEQAIKNSRETISYINKPEKISISSNKSRYDLHINEGEDELVIKDISETFKDTNYAWATRQFSTSLRHGVPVNFIVEQLSKDAGSDFHSFGKVIGRVLKKYIPDGSKATEKCPSCESKLVFQEGCVLCLNCGFSKCS
jgi:ribonucleoside-diphosphate reductase alpha chain